jgi:hypothetical protein
MSKFTEEQIKEANQQIAELLDGAYTNINKAEAIANEFGLEFDWDLEYGMNGTFYGTGYKPSWAASDDDWISSDNQGWNPSSQSC